ncbi:hypothetical protein Rhopal_001847-T1 [Rhodotorula paludigena]|uniref:Uncharacterized protein n=1 Tax=Rhodotorula paludigena TaxID=86838 RepID=A0AAV5G8H6_9BASI|nr:hypothetical protein Rhopal_001847-T1 [Rhodotorula paludigena]
MARSDTKSSQQRKALHRSTHDWKAQADSKKSSSTQSARDAALAAPQPAASVNPLVALAATAQQMLLTAQSAAAAGTAQDAVQTAALDLLGDTRIAIQAEVAHMQARLEAPRAAASASLASLSLPPSSLISNSGYAADADNWLLTSSAHPEAAADSPSPPRRYRPPQKSPAFPPQQQEHVQQLQLGAMLDDADDDAAMRDAEREQAFEEAFEVRLARKLEEQERKLEEQHAREEVKLAAQHAREEQVRLEEAQERAAREKAAAVARVQRDREQERRELEQERLRVEAEAARSVAQHTAHAEEARRAAARAEQEKAAAVALAQHEQERDRREREAEQARRSAERVALEKKARRAAEQAAQDKEAAVARARSEWEQQWRDESAAEARGAAQEAERKACEQDELDTRRAEQEAQKAAFLKASSRAPQGQELIEISMRLHACTFGPNILEEAKKKPPPPSTLPPPNGLTTIPPLDTDVVTPDPKRVHLVSKPRRRALLAVDGNNGPEYFVKTVLGAFTSRGKETVKVRWGDQSVTDEPLSDSIKSTLAYKTYVREVAVAREIAARARAQSVAHAEDCVALVNRERAEKKAQEVAARLAARDPAALNKKVGLTIFTTGTSSPAPSSPRGPQPQPLQTRPHAQQHAAVQPQRRPLPAPPPLKAPPARKLASDARHASLAPAAAPPASPRAPAKVPAKLAAQAKRPPALPPSPPRFRPDASTSEATAASTKRRKDRSFTKDPLARAPQQRSKSERGKGDRSTRAESSSRREPFTSAQRRQEEPRWASEEERERKDELRRSQYRREDEQYERNKQEITRFTEMARRATEYSDVDDYMEAEMVAREEREEQEVFEAAERSMQVFGGSD